MKQDPDWYKSYYQANRERILEQHRQRSQTDEFRQKRRAYRAANRDRINAQKRSLRERSPEQHRDEERRRKHGIAWADAFAAMWQMQAGRCYLCGDALSRAVIDHDHSHCPAEQSCSVCRRGLACNRCNKLIGLAEDNPALLRLIADNLDPVLLATRARIATAPRQETLDGNP